MSILTLTSDLGENNFGLAAFKANAQIRFPEDIIIDLFHHNEIFDIESIAYQVLGALNTFPKDSIHIVYSRYTTSKSDLLIIKLLGQYVIAPNNGIVSLLYFIDYQAKVYIQKLSEEIQDYFEIVDMIKSSSVSALPIAPQFTHTKPFNTDLMLLEDKILCRILYVNSLGNIILNIQKEEFYQFISDRAFHILLVNIKLFQFSPNYSVAYNPNRIGALFNATGFLEVFMIGGNLAELFNMNKWKNNKIEIYIDNDTNREINFQARI